jgi:hypothetical protein
VATGDQNDFAARLYVLLPSRWFPAGDTVLSGVLAGFGNAWAAIYSQINFAMVQARIATATDVWLNGVGADFFGGMLPRFTNEQDPAYRTRIQQNLLAPKATRAAVIAAVKNLTGRTPTVFEPADTGDTGGYGVAMGYGVAGAYGDLGLPFQFFITCKRPIGGGIANVDGYGGGSGGYGAGAIEYSNPSMLLGQVTDAAIQQAVLAAKPAATIAWMNITS